MAKETSHVKHPKLTRADRSFFGRNAISILGAPCSEIQRFGKSLQHALADTLSTIWVDQDHAYFDQEPAISEISISEATQTYPDHWQLSSIYPKDQTHPSLSETTDLALVNGNHFQCESEWILYHPSKLESLERKVERVKQVKVWVISDEYTPEVAHLMNPEATVLDPNKESLLAEFLQSQCPVPELKALILTGGKSARMGKDKRLLDYHGLPQEEFMLQIVKANGLDAYISVAYDASDSKHNQINDRFVGLGPFGGILSAMMYDPNAAWLVLACDLPSFDNEAVETLMRERKSSKFATAFFNEETSFPDPLCTIYEPKMYPKMLQFLAMGYSCPRKALINSNTHVIVPKHKDWLENVNTPEQFQRFKSRMS